MNPMLAMGLMNMAGGLGGMLGGGGTKYARGTEWSRSAATQLLGIGGPWGEKSAAQAPGIETGILERGGMEKIRQGYKSRFMENFQGSFKGARKAAKAGARHARQNVRSAGKQAGADMSQYLAATGLDSSTIAAQAQSGIAYNTSRALADVDIQLGNVMAELQLKKSAAKDAIMARNMGIDEQTFQDQMAVLAANAGYGPNASSMFFNQGGGFGMPMGDPFSAGAGAAGLTQSVLGLFGGAPAGQAGAQSMANAGMYNPMSGFNFLGV